MIYWWIKLSLVPVPSESPDNFTVVVSSSTSITASWQLPPSDARNGIITGFKLFFKKKELIDPPIVLTINNRTSRHQRLTGLHEYTEYTFQILAFTSVGDGPNSSVQVKRTLEDGKRSNRFPKILSKNVNVHSYEKNCDQQRNIQFFSFCGSS